MNKKTLFMASRYGLEEVEIIKETEKQFKVGSNRQYRNIINKKELELEGNMTHPYRYLAISLDRNKAIELWNDNLVNYIKQTEKNLKELKTQLLKC